MAMASKRLTVFCAAGAHVHAIKMEWSSSTTASIHLDKTFQEGVEKRAKLCDTLQQCKNYQDQAKTAHEIYLVDLWFDFTYSFPEVAEWVQTGQFQEHEYPKVALASFLLTRKPEETIFPCAEVTGLGNMEIRSMVIPDKINQIPRYQQLCKDSLTLTLGLAQLEDEFPLLFVAAEVGSAIDSSVQLIPSSSIEAVDAEYERHWKLKQIEQLKQQQEKITGTLNALRNQIMQTSNSQQSIKSSANFFFDQ